VLVGNDVFAYRERLPADLCREQTRLVVDADPLEVLEANVEAQIRTLVKLPNDPTIRDPDAAGTGRNGPVESAASADQRLVSL
jgi:hypothetical protein